MQRPILTADDRDDKPDQDDQGDAIIVRIADCDCEEILDPTDLWLPEDDPDFDPGHDPVGLAIEAPRGVLPTTPGWTVYAVRLDSAGEVEAGQALSSRYPSSGQARILADYFADARDRAAIAATHLVVNDHRGNEHYRRAIAA